MHCTLNDFLPIIAIGRRRLRPFDLPLRPFFFLFSPQDYTASQLPFLRSTVGIIVPRVGNVLFYRTTTVYINYSY